MISAGASALIVLQALTAAPPGARPEGKMRSIEVQGHRGARAMRPENTLPAFAYALEVGVDTLELDVLVTKDDALVVGHDPVLDSEICLGPGGAPLPANGVTVRALTLAELKRYDCGKRRHPRFPEQEVVPGTTMPTLDEVFELVKTSHAPAAKRVKLNIETKSVPGEPELAPSPEVFAALVVSAIRRSGLFERCIVQSFDHRTLVAAKKLEPKLTVAALTSDNLIDFVAIAKSIGAEIVSPDKLWITAADVERLHVAGVRVIPWTANTEADWRRLVDLGVDGIITDDPAKLLRWLGRVKE